MYGYVFLLLKFGIYIFLRKEYKLYNQGLVSEVVLNCYCYIIREI